jgi:GT2 family glycosyltransferase
MASGQMVWENTMPEGGPMSVSIVVPTYRRERVLRDMLSRLLEQVGPGMEVIVVDQSESHEPATIRFLEAHRDRLRYIQRPPRGLPAARNAGLDVATGEIVIFLDDDVLCEPGLLAAHIAAYRDPRVGAVAGRNISSGLEHLEPEPARVGYISPWASLTLNYYARTERTVHTVRGCNMSFRRALLEEVGGFDERYIGNAVMEECDICARIRHKGYVIRFVPAAEVFHLFAPQGGCRNGALASLRMRYQSEFANETLFFLEHCSRYWLPFFIGKRLRRIAGSTLRFGPRFTLNAFLMGVRAHRAGRPATYLSSNCQSMASDHQDSDQPGKNGSGRDRSAMQLSPTMGRERRES